jgi:hypothetical protein
LPFWTIEEVADHLALTVTQVRESRRKGEYPGNLGRLRGRRLMFDADLVQAGPTVAQTTGEPLEAILWTLQGIESKVGEIAVHLAAAIARENKITLAEAARFMQSYYFGEVEPARAMYEWDDTTTTTTEEEE